MNAALVPIKSLSAGKSRLLDDLAAADVEALCLAMLQDVVAALLATPSLDRVVVATPDEVAAHAAESLGAEAFLGPDPGLNPAIETAADRLAAEGAVLVVTVLGDVAAADPTELDHLIAGTKASAAKPGGAAVGLAASSDGGTGALVRTPHDVIPAQFGRESAARHRAEADANGVPLYELDLPSLRIDLDQIEDVKAFLKCDTGGLRTRACLAAAGFAATPAETHPA